jgi:nucleotide-binding universal stress UspA family protein
MFHHLLVPLDGSSTAETVLPATVRLARLLGAQVTLLHVVERDAPHEIHGERHLVQTSEARRYLDGVAERAFPPELHVERHVQADTDGGVLAGIMAYLEGSSADLIVMCTHGRAGLQRWLFGSVAQRVLAQGIAPVLLIRPRADGVAPELTCQRFLIPLDGATDHEQGLSIARDLARECGAALHLVQVVPTTQTLSGDQAATARLLPGATTELLDMACKSAKAYLRDHVDRLQTDGFSAMGEVLRGDAAPQIVRAARKADADLVVLATHRKKGLEAFWSGSVTPKVLHRTHRPMLLIPVE